MTTEKQIHDALRIAATSCPHEIDRDRVILHFDPKQPGHNALNQLGRRLDAASKEQPIDIQTAQRHAVAQMQGEPVAQILRCRYPVSTDLNPVGFDWDIARLNEVVASITAPATAEQPQAREITDAEIDALINMHPDLVQAIHFDLLPAGALVGLIRAAIALANGNGER